MKEPIRSYAYLAGPFIDIWHADNDRRTYRGTPKRWMRIAKVAGAMAKRGEIVCIPYVVTLIGFHVEPKESAK